MNAVLWMMYISMSEPATGVLAMLGSACAVLGPPFLLFLQVGEWEKGTEKDNKEWITLVISLTANQMTNAIVYELFHTPDEDILHTWAWGWRSLYSAAVIITADFYAQAIFEGFHWVEKEKPSGEIQSELKSEECPLLNRDTEDAEENHRVN